jgi:ATPase family AAA domain-containing protein 3A/B
MLRNAVSAYGARVTLGAAAVAVPAVASCAKDDKKANTVTSSFDPEALERGAKALREINSSTHAKRVRMGNNSGVTDEARSDRDRSS